MEEQKPIKETIQAIAFELRESGATEWEVLKIIKELEGFAGSETQLRKKSSELLEKLNPAAAKTFKSFEKMRVFTSNEKREPFDRGNIIKSLLKETSVSRHVAEKIGAEVEDRIKDLKLQELNTQIIREMVNVKLLEYGHESVHNEYARIGLPVFEVKKRLEENGFENPEILREYNWLFSIPKNAKEMHFDRAIYIYSPEFFSTKIFSETKFLHGTPQDIALEAAKSDKTCSTPLTLAGLNHSFENPPKSKKKIEEDATRAGKIFELTGKKRIAELALFSDHEWANSKSRSAYLASAGAFLENPAMKNSLEFAISVDSRYKLKALENPGSAIILNNSRERVSANQKCVVTGNAAGLIQLTGINLCKILDHSTEQDGFLENLNEVLSKIRQLGEKKIQELGKRRVKIETDSKANAVALAGLAKSAKTINENPAKAAEAIISTVQKNGLYVSQMDHQDSAEIFGIAPEKAQLQEILLKIGQKQRKNFGFVYSAGSLKEAEELLSDCPCVQILPGNDKAQTD